jgi:Ca-activated chloride channel family protein
MKIYSKIQNWGLGCLLFAQILSACDGNKASQEKHKHILDGRKDMTYVEETQQAMVESAPPELPPIAGDTSKIENNDEAIVDNPFKNVAKDPLSTFSIDVDNASYTQIRNFIENGISPSPYSVRIEEMINYFSYDYPKPIGDNPFSIYTEVASCPWNEESKLVHIGLQGKTLDYQNLKASNLVFLIDISGSMDPENRLPLVIKSFKLLLNELSEKDKVSIVVYAGSEGLVLPATSANEKEKIIKSLDNLKAGGSTAGGAGIELAYKIAEENLISGGNNRIILCTDGDFNVGVSSTEELVRMVEEKRKKDIYLTICGFGMGNYQDNRMKEIAKNANGNYFFIDNEQEARKVFVREMRANLFTIAKDVKIQVEFSPKWVESYRLIGYENRVMANKDFDNDKKDAGELGAGHTVTALYEIVPTKAAKSTQNAKDIITLNLRYKPIGVEKSLLIKQSVLDNHTEWQNSSANFKFSAAVASFGMLLRNSPYKGNSDAQKIIAWASNSLGTDEQGDRSEFLKIVQKWVELKKTQ